MSAWLQYILVGVAVVAAMGYLVHEAWRALRGHPGGCGPCRSCAPDAGPKPGPSAGRTVFLPATDFRPTRRRP